MGTFPRQLLIVHIRLSLNSDSAYQHHSARLVPGEVMH